MIKNTPEQNPEEEKKPKKKKLSIKQQLTKLFLTSDIKNKKLWKPLRISKTELIKNFHDGGFDVANVNSLFWVYFHDHKDVYVPRYLKSLVAKQEVFVDRVDHSFSLEEYLVVLKKIRLALEPFTKSIQKLLAMSKTYAQDAVNKESADTLYSDFDHEEEAEKYHMLAKQQFSNLLSSEIVADEVSSPEWFSSMCESIGETREQHEYKDLIVFAVLGMHYFDKKHLVYSAFSQENLSKFRLYFQGSTKNNQPIELTLGDFLAIVDQLNFKKHFFDLQK